MIEIVADEKDFVVASKPCGISVQRELQDATLPVDGAGNSAENEACSYKGNYKESLLDILKSQLGYDILLPVHRLDKVTSGLILVAKSRAACSTLSQLFSSREVDKFYLALSNRKPKKKQGWIIGDMAKSRDGSWKLIKSKNNPAITQFFSYSSGKGQRIFIVKPTTGKTHQIRVALKSLGSPIVGDQRYSKETADRTYLHAYCLNFSYLGNSYQYMHYPVTGELFVNNELKQIVSKIGNPMELSWPASTGQTN